MHGRAHAWNAAWNDYSQEIWRSGACGASVIRMCAQHCRGGARRDGARAAWQVRCPCALACTHHHSTRVRDHADLLRDMPSCAIARRAARSTSREPPAMKEKLCSTCAHPVRDSKHSPAPLESHFWRRMREAPRSCWRNSSVAQVLHKLRECTGAGDSVARGDGGSTSAVDGSRSSAHPQRRETRWDSPEKRWNAAGRRHGARGLAQTWPAHSPTEIVRHRMSSREHAECRSTRSSTRDPSAVDAGST